MMDDLVSTSSMANQPVRDVKDNAEDGKESNNNNENQITLNSGQLQIDEDSKHDNQSVLNSLDMKSDSKRKPFKANISGVTLWKEIDEAKTRRDSLQEQIKQLAREVTPIEFESYHEFFLIKTFKKGISASGHVDIDSLQRRNTSVYYKKIKRRSYTATTDSTNSTSTSSTNSVSDEDDEGADDDQDDGDFYGGGDKAGAIAYEDELFNELENSGASSKRRTRAQHAAQIELKQPESPEKEIATVSKTPDGNTSCSNMNVSSDLGVSRRRSSRLSQKTSDSKEASFGPDASVNDSSTQIRDLYESLVPKIREPYRRSDWILPSKFRYTPEKQMRTRPVFEKVKINELVASERIRNVLSRFEGGVAGVRKRGWNALS